MSSVKDEEEVSHDDSDVASFHNCPKQYCRLGCICDSIDENASSPRTPTHCGKASCMFDCVCEEVKVEEEDELEPGEIRVQKQKKAEALDKGRVI